MKNNFTQKEVILSVFNYLPDNFDGIELVQKVRVILMRPKMYPETILRILRKLRQQNKINYICNNKGLSKYVKL